VRVLWGFFLAVTLAWGQTKSAIKKSATPAKPAAQAASKAKPTVKTTVTASKSAKKRGPVIVRRPTQQQPSPDRYKEIQQALLDKGYFSGMPDGNWGPESVDALKRFQKDQNLDVDGKLGALSLMALGLGPKRGTAAVAAKAAADLDPAEPPPVAQPEP
jgi:peptidoglycan hydrolase-like protein with peptidoglycan-binding domain